MKRCKIQLLEITAIFWQGFTTYGHDCTYNNPQRAPFWPETPFARNKLLRNAIKFEFVQFRILLLKAFLCPKNSLFYAVMIFEKKPI